VSDDSTGPSGIESGAATAGAKTENANDNAIAAYSVGESIFISHFFVVF